jgi:hypothetical protein
MRSLLLPIYLAILTATLVSRPATADEGTGAKTLSARLAGHKYVGIRIGEQPQFYSLTLYSAEQHKQNVAKWRKYEELMKKAETAADANTRQAISAELGTFRLREAYYTIVAIGDDYVELASALDEDKVSLIPLHFIRRIELPRKDVKAEREP